MKKRIWAVLLAGSMLLTACGSSGNKAVSDASKGSEAQNVAADAGIEGQPEQKVTMKVSVGVADNHFEAIAVKDRKSVV